jgi:hypothetical protein
MDTLNNEFAQIASVTAWPIVTLVIASLYRADIRSLLTRFKKGKIGEAEFEFGETVKELAHDIAASAPATELVELKPETYNLVKINPQAALLKSWSGIRALLTDLARKNNLLDDKTSRSYPALVRALENAGVINKTYALGILALLQLYNQTTRQADFKPTEEAVLGYLNVAEKMKQILLQAQVSV